MNHAHLSEYMQKFSDDLHAFGVPREEAEAIAQYAKASAVASEAQYRKNNQFLLDLRRVGTQAMAERLGISPQAIRNRRRKIAESKYASSVVGSACA